MQHKQSSLQVTTRKNPLQTQSINTEIIPKTSKGQKTKSEQRNRSIIDAFNKECNNGDYIISIPKKTDKHKCITECTFCSGDVFTPHSLCKHPKCCNNNHSNGTPFSGQCPYHQKRHLKTYHPEFFQQF